jgi:hypothetical protein
MGFAKACGMPIIEGRVAIAKYRLKIPILSVITKAHKISAVRLQNGLWHILSSLRKNMPSGG